MHDGIIAGRYAKAFLEYTDAHGKSKAVADQVSVLLSAMGKLPKFRASVSGAYAMDFAERLTLLKSALAPAAIEESLVNLYSLMNKNSRLEQFRMTLLDYLVLYRKENNVRMVMVTSANDDEKVAEMAGELAEKSFGQKVVSVQKVDPSLLGGFIIDSWGYRLDASVRGALEKMDKGLKGKNNRKV